MAPDLGDRPHGGLPIFLLGLIDTALWDLAGRYHGAPTWELLGTFAGDPGVRVDVDVSSIAESLEVATQCMELGYPAIKLHGWGDARRDAELCTAFREHVGSDLPLMYDGSAAFDLPDAVYVGMRSPQLDTCGTRSRFASSASRRTSGWPTGYVFL